MRHGRNPNTTAQTKPRERITVGVITHFPNEWQSYHLHRWGVTALSLRSLQKHVNLPIHLAIWDNGSHDKFREWLTNEIEPDTLILSENVGKSVARKALFGMFPPDTIMAIADDDIFYFPSWLLPQIELLEHFDKAEPKVGTVTGYPVRTMYRWANDCAKEFGRNHGELVKGSYVTAEWDADYCASIGREYDWHKKTSGNVDEYKVIFDGKEALTLGHHCQFICYNGRIAPLLRWDIDAMADEKPFDRAVDEKYMRLCTTQRLTMHMGNVLDDKLLGLAKKYNLSVTVDHADTLQPVDGSVKAGRHAAAVVATALPDLRI